MSTYFVGDVHGCYNNLRSILDYVHFNPELDVLHLTGDLVSRGPNSLQVLRFIKNFNKSAKTVLGNHDLHLLSTYFGTNYKKLKNQFSEILNAPDLEELMYWLRHQPILHIDENKKILMIHAGIHPQWDIKQTKLYAKEIEHILTGNCPNLLFKDSSILNEELTLDNTNFTKDQIKRAQYNLNVFTKIRYVHKNGYLDLQCKHNPEHAPKNIYPWFNLSKLITPNYNIIFGHWASLSNTPVPNGIYGLDSGCCWGGYLTLLKWENKKVVQIPCTPPS